MIQRISELADRYDLKPHPEGGFYREVYRSAGVLSCPWEPARELNFATSIFFMLTKGNFSAFHRIRSDELWHFYEGDPVDIYILEERGIRSFTLSHDNYMDYVPAGAWFASRTRGEYSFTGCTVSPAFDFRDFEMAERQRLIERYPDSAAIISELTRI